jgi:anti-anti-sigma factor
MNITIHSANLVAVLDIEGEVAGHCVEQLGTVVRQAVQAGCSDVILNLYQADALMSDCVRFFVAMQEMLEKEGVRMTLVNLPPNIAKTLELVGIKKSLRICENLPRALEKYSLAEADLAEGFTPRSGQKDTEPPVQPGPHMEKKSQRDNEPHAPTREEMQKLISRHLPGRMAVDIVDWFVTHNHSVGEMETIAKALGENPRAVRKKLKELVACHVLKPLGKDVYNYAPEGAVHEQLQDFLKRWHRKDERARILPLVLASEK